MARLLRTGQNFLLVMSLGPMNKLIKRLNCFNSDGVEAKHVVISLFIGPRLITSKKWQPVLESLAKRGLIQMIVCDEAQ